MWSVRKVFAFYRGRAQVMFLDSNTATASHKARTHGPGWRTAHASSLVVVLGSDSWKLRWHMRRDEMSWDKVRRAQMRWSVECEECSVKCGAWRVQCEVWSVKCEVWTVKCGVWSVKYGLWSVKCGVWSVECAVGSVQCECGVWSVKCGVRSAQSAVWRVRCVVWSVECEDCQVWSVTWSFKCDMWNKAPVSQSTRTHGLRWRTAHASSIDEKGLIYIYIFKATSAPPRAGTTGIIYMPFSDEARSWLYLKFHVWNHHETPKHHRAPTWALVIFTDRQTACIAIRCNLSQIKMAE